MAVLIKGAELPKCCADCFAVEFSACEGSYCGLTQQYIEYGTISNRRQDYCPLVEFPENALIVDRHKLFNGEYNLYSWDEIEEAEIALDPS